MISANELALVGKVSKTHGIGGELSVVFMDTELREAAQPGRCVVMDIDGIFVPFFIAEARKRGEEAQLIRFDGVNTQEEAAAYVGKDVYYALDDMPEAGTDIDADDDGFYAGQLIGFKALLDDGTEIGEIIDIDEATENVLFVVQPPQGEKLVYIPVADEFITDISTNNHSISFDLPEGLLQI